MGLGFTIGQSDGKVSVNAPLKGSHLSMNNQAIGQNVGCNGSSQQKPVSTMLMNPGNLGQL